MRLLGRQIRTGALCAALLLWATAVISVFYAYHYSEVAAPLAGLMRWGANLLTAGSLGVMATAWGRLLLRWARVRTQSRLEALVFGFAVGYGLVATIMLILGLAGWLLRPIIWATTLLLAVGGLPEICRLLKEWHRGLAALSWPPKPAWNFDTFLGLCLAIFLLLGLLLASLPPTSWDALIVHLVIPKEVLAQGRISPDLENAHALARRPILQHMLFTWGMAIRGDTVPKLIHFSFALGTVLTVYAIARRHLRCSPVLAAVLFYLTPVVRLIAPWAYVDLGVTFYTAISLYALLNWLHHRETQWCLLAALLAAWSGQVKNNGWFVVVFIVGMVVYELLRCGGPWERRVRLFIQFSLVGLLASLPWLVCNYWVGQAPLPQAHSVVSKIGNSIRERGGRFPELVQGGIRALTLPWRMTMKGAQGTYEFDGEVGPLFLLFLPLWVLIWREERTVRVLILCVVTEFLLWLGWFSGGRLQNRLLMPIFPLLGILTARALEKLREFALPHFSAYHFARLVVLVPLLLALVTQFRLSSAFNPAAFILGFRDKMEYLSYVLDSFYPSSPHYYRAMRQLESSLPALAKVGLLWPEGRVYYVPRPYLAHPFWLSSSPEEMWEVSQKLGLSHVLVGRSVLDFQLHRSGDPRLDRQAIAAYMDHLDAFLREHGSLLSDEHQDYELYALVEGQP